jgi:hypothetical protein
MMTIDRASNLISALLGFLGAILIAKGVLKLTPEIIAEQVYTYMSFNNSQLVNIAEQKADVVSGSVLIALAFLFQITNIIFVRKNIIMFESFWSGVGLCLAIACLILTMILFLDSALTKHYTIEATKAVAYRTLEDLLKMPLTHSSLNEIKESAKTVKDFEKKENETPQDFLKRYITYLDFKLKDEIDWSNFK